MSDTKDWPLVPVDPACVPEGWEAVRVGFPGAGETAIAYKNAVPHTWTLDPDDSVIRIILRPIPKPIKLPTTIVPSGWWVAKDEDNQAWVYEAKPSIGAFAWIQEGVAGYKLPPWIAAQLPQEWHALPWDQSAMQQTEGGDL